MKETTNHHSLTALFDLDGTLLDTLDDLTDAVNFALGKAGLAPRTRDEVCSFVGNGIGNLLRRAANDPPPDTEKVIGDAFYPYYSAHAQDKTRPYPGVVECLAALRREGIPTAIISNKSDDVVRVLCERFFPGLYDVCRGELPGVPRKPAPDIVFSVLSELGASAADAVLIGDSDVDIKTAQNAKIPCASVTWGFRSPDFLVFSGAQTLITSPSELATFLITLQHIGANS